MAFGVRYVIFDGAKVDHVGDYKTRNFDNPAWSYLPESLRPYSVQGHSWRTYMPGPVGSNISNKNVSQEMRAIEPNA